MNKILALPIFLVVVTIALGTFISAEKPPTTVETQGITSSIELDPLGSFDGAINPQTRNILFYGDVLCEIESAGSMYLQFGGDTLVKHLDDCTSRNGNQINLNPSMDTVFHEGDILVLERITVNWEEVFRSQT